MSEQYGFKQSQINWTKTISNEFHVPIVSRYLKELYKNPQIQFTSFKAKDILAYGLTCMQINNKI